MGETLIAKDLTGHGTPVFSAGQALEPWGFTTHNRRKYRRGTIIIGARGTLGCPRLPDFDEYVSTQTTIAVLPSRGVDPRFLLGACSAIRYDEIGAKQAIPMLTVGVLNNVHLLLPPLAEQRRIAAVLQAADAAVAAAETVIDQTEKVKRGLVEQLLTRGMPGRHTRFKMTEIGEVPEPWSHTRITDVARLESGHTPSRKHPEYWDGDIPWISLHDTRRLNAPILSETTQTVSEQGVANSSARLLPKGTVAFSRTATVGLCTIMGRPMTTSQDFANYVCGPKLLNTFLMYNLRSRQSEWNALKSGSTHKTIYMPDFEKLQILLPSLDEQADIVAVIEAFQGAVDAAHATLTRSMELRRGLSADLLSGRVRVAA